MLHVIASWFFGWLLFFELFSNQQNFLDPNPELTPDLHETLIGKLLSFLVIESGDLCKYKKFKEN